MQRRVRALCEPCGTVLGRDRRDLRDDGRGERAAVGRPTPNVERPAQRRQPHLPLVGWASSRRDKDAAAQPHSKRHDALLLVVGRDALAKVDLQRQQHATRSVRDLAARLSLARVSDHEGGDVSLPLNLMVFAAGAGASSDEPLRLWRAKIQVHPSATAITGLSDGRGIPRRKRR